VKIIELKRDDRNTANLRPTRGDNLNTAAKRKRQTSFPPLFENEPNDFSFHIENGSEG